MNLIDMIKPAVTEITEPIDELLYVVRNSSTQALFGFCSAYFYSESKIGVVSALFVDPSKRNLSIGHSLHQRALRGLLNKPGLKKLKLGGTLPSIFLGISMVDLTKGERLKCWFKSSGWNSSSSGFRYILKLSNLGNWNPPDDLVNDIQQVSFSFDLIHGQEAATTVLEHVSRYTEGETLALYQFALSDGNGIVRAKSPVDGSLVGTVITSRMNSHLSTLIPALNAPHIVSEFPEDTCYCAGGIIAPILTKNPHEAIILQGLILLGIQQIKVLGFNSCIISEVQEEQRDILLGMGFNVLDAFEELSCEAKQIRLD